MSMSIWIWIEQMKNNIVTPGVVLLLSLTAFVLSSCGIAAPRSNAGYANLDSPGIADTDRTLSLSLGKATLRFAAHFLDDEPETQALLRSLDGVRVRIYQVNGDSGRIARNFERMGVKLSKDGWEPVMLINQEDELVQMFAKQTASGMQGLTIVSADADEVVVVNVMGNIEPEKFSDVMVALNVEDAPEVHLASTN
ncbi:MAG: DUF4252 domain-containing protein [Lysobacterales bacterium]